MSSRDFAQGLAFSPNGLRIAVGGDTISVYDSTTGEELAPVDWYARHAGPLAYHPDGSSIASVIEGKTVKVFEAQGRELPATSHSKAVRRHPGRTGGQLGPGTRRAWCHR